MFLTSLAMLGVATLGTIFLRGSARAWWVGFALFAGGYLAIAAAPWLSDAIRPQLGTTQLLKEAHERITREVSPAEVAKSGLRAERKLLVAQLREAASSARSGDTPAEMAAKRTIAKLNQQIAAINDATIYDQFERVGHSLFTLLVGLLGGMVAVWFNARRESAADTRTD
jgi:hypothetical protein